jgi:hypothetical protein
MGRGYRHTLGPALRLGDPHLGWGRMTEQGFRREEWRRIGARALRLGLGRPARVRRERFRWGPEWMAGAAARAGTATRSLAPFPRPIAARWWRPPTATGLEAPARRGLSARPWVRLVRGAARIGGRAAGLARAGRSRLPLGMAMALPDASRRAPGLSGAWARHVGLVAAGAGTGPRYSTGRSPSSDRRGPVLGKVTVVPSKPPRLASTLGGLGSFEGMRPAQRSAVAAPVAPREPATLPRLPERPEFRVSPPRPRSPAGDAPTWDALSDWLDTAARRPPRGISGFDERLTPIYPGMTGPS